MTELVEQHSESSWRFAWRTRAHHLLELEWLPERRRWLKRTKHYDPQVKDAPWSTAQQQALKEPQDVGHARRIVEEYAREHE